MRQSAASEIGHQSHPQPLSNRGVGITMTSQKESYWAAKAPLWVIAFSLLTIAGCLVLLVMRPVVGESAQASVSTNQVPLLSGRSEKDSPFREHLHADSGLRVSYDASSKVSSSLKR